MCGLYIPDVTAKIVHCGNMVTWKTGILNKFNEKRLLIP